MTPEDISSSPVAAVDHGLADGAATNAPPDFYSIFKGYEQLLVMARDSVSQSINAVEYVEGKMLSLLATLRSSKKMVFAAPLSMAVLSGSVPIGRKWCVVTLVVAVVLAAGYTVLEHVLHKETQVSEYAGHPSIVQMEHLAESDGIAVAKQMLGNYKALDAAHRKAQGDKAFTLSAVQRAHAYINYGRDGLLAGSSAVLLWLLVR